MLEYEEKAKSNGFLKVCGVDEAGAGPLAGPVVAAAVILPADGKLLEKLQELGVNDSKKMTEKKREQLFPLICQEAFSYGIGEVTAQEIDDTDILSGRIKAMNLAMDAMEIQADFALIDGNRDKGKQAEITVPHELIVKGDALSLSIAAASILAKVHRDHLMMELDGQYPEYGFGRHKGYGTKLHFEKIKEHKLCKAHRVTFLKKKWEVLGL